jgi:hypothetical protein
VTERMAECNQTLVAEDGGTSPLRTSRPCAVRVGDKNAMRRSLKLDQ